jgi:hypothetical protein
MKEKPSLATVADARLVIWHRLAITARCDGSSCDWFEQGWDEPSIRRLVKASNQVATTIERRIENAKKARRRAIR